MKISIPDKIKSEIDVIEAVYLETDNTNAGEKSPAFVGSIISDKHIRKISFIELSNSVYERCSNIQYRILYKNGVTEILKFFTKQDSLYKFGINENNFKSTIIKPDNERKCFLKDKSKKLIKNINSFFNTICEYFKEPLIYFFKTISLYFRKIFIKNKKSYFVHTGSAKDLVKTNNKSNYPNTKLGKKRVISKLNQKYKKALKEKTHSVGDKNLIYYSVAGSEDWIDLLKINIFSLLKFKDVDVDLLFITTNKLKKEILKIENIDKLNIDFLIVKEPEDGIEASMNKLLIYKYKKIKSYGKILFLDCDTKIVNLISNIFNNILNPEKFYTAWKSYYINKILFDAFSQPFHGIGLFTGEDVENCRKNNQHPFNAGQFLFCVNDMMLKHIENVHWLSKEWPGDYFFEQAFLVHYMCLYNLTESSLLDEKVNLYSINPKEPSCATVKDINDEKVVIFHFIGNSANIDFKLNFIKNFTNANI